MQFFTIGVYNSEEDDFFGKLIQNGIDTFSDIRQHRGVRGARYSFVNSNSLQLKLKDIGIRYDYTAGLAPTPEIRSLQNKTDKLQKKSKKERTQLSDAFTFAYRKEILNNFDFLCYLQKLAAWKAEKVALFCVEEHPAACHRLLVAEKLNELGCKITHL